jgi:hypothetical protein
MKMSSMIDRPRCIAFASTKDRRSMEQLSRSMEQAGRLPRQRRGRLADIRGPENPQRDPAAAGVWGWIRREGVSSPSYNAATVQRLLPCTDRLLMP